MFQSSCTGTPQQNERVERKHKHILDVARALRFQGNLPIGFWGECVLAVAYLINRTPSLLLDGKSPYEVVYNKPPDYSHIRIFGSLCYAHNQGRGGDKFSSKSWKCVFMGYPYGKKGWKLYDLTTKKFFVSRDVIFYEGKFPFADSVLSDHAPAETTSSSEDATKAVVLANGDAFPDNTDDEVAVREGSEVGAGSPEVTEETLGRGHRRKE